jgi:glycosyltransferase involved in cell wall biosynthesis
MKAIGPNVTLIGQRFSHHASHSGYDQLAVHLNAPLEWHRGATPRPSSLSLPYINRWFTFEAAVQETCVALEMRQIDHKRIVHFLYSEQAYRTAAAVCGGSAVKWIATFHQPPSILSITGIDANVVKGLATVVLMGNTQRSYFESLGARSIHVIPHGIDCSYYCPSNQLRRPFRILTVGHWLRDFQTYFKVAEAALQQRLPLRFRLISSTFAPNVVVPNNCVICRSVSDEQLLSEYAEASCFYLPLLDATANNALLEALACGLPAVVSDKGSIREYVGEGGAVVLCKNGVEEHLSALLSVSNIGRDYSQRSLAARETASRYDWSRIVSEYESVYEQFA